MNKFYKFTEENYKQLSAELHKFGNVKNAIDLLNGADVIFVKEKKVQKNTDSINNQKEVLTNKKMKKIFGANYSGLIFYNFDFEKWNVKNPMESVLKNKTYTLNLIKRIMDKKMQDLHLELVSLVTMPVADANYIGWGRSLGQQKFDKSGHVLAGTLLWRDKVSGKLYWFDNGWQQGEFFLCERNSQEDAINRFVQDVVRYDSFRNNLLRLK